MSPGATYALMSFLLGLLLVFGWLYATADNPRALAILKKSLLLFALPILFWPNPLFRFPLGLWVALACEEGLKAFASTREENRRDKFWLVVLFGIWELALSKPLWGFAVGRDGGAWDRLSMIGFLYATALPVLMHAVTAAIYAFTFERRLWAAFLVSCFVHAVFNAVATTSPVVVIAETLVLTALLAAIVWSDRPPVERVS